MAVISPVVEVDGLVQVTAEGGGIADKDVLAGDPTAFDLGDAALGDAVDERPGEPVKISV